MNVKEAYRAAWREARSRGDFAEDILLRHLDAVSEWPGDDEDDDEDDDGPTTREVGQQFLLDAWRERVPPRRLGRYAGRVGLRMILGLVRGFWRLLRSAWVPGWMQPPDDVDVYDPFEDDALDDLDIPTLPCEVILDDDWNRDLLMRAVAARPKPTDEFDDDDEEPPCHDIPIWVKGAQVRPRLDVMVGKERLVGARSDILWDFLRKIAGDFQGIDGELEVYDPEDSARHRIDVQMPRDEFPPEYVKAFFDGE